MMQPPLAADIRLAQAWLSSTLSELFGTHSELEPGWGWPFPADFGYLEGLFY